MKLDRLADETEEDYIYRLRTIRSGSSCHKEQEKRIQLLDAVECIKAGLDSVDDSFKKRIQADLEKLIDEPETLYRTRRRSCFR